MTSSVIGDSVEGESLRLQCQKFSFIKPTKNKTTSQITYNFKMHIQGYAKVSQTLSANTQPIKKTSKLELDAQIYGDIISGFSCKPPNKSTPDNTTSTEKYFDTRGHSFAYVESEIRDNA